MSTNDPHPQNSCDGSQQPRFRFQGIDTPAVTSVCRDESIVRIEIRLGTLMKALPTTARASVRHHGSTLKVHRRNVWTLKIAGTQATIVSVDEGELPERVPDWLECVCEVVGYQSVRLYDESQNGDGLVMQATHDGEVTIAEGSNPVGIYATQQRE